MSVLKIGIFILLAALVIYMLVFILPAMPLLFGLVVISGFVILPLRQLFVRWVERVNPRALAPDDRFIPWPEYWSAAFRIMLGFGAVAAVARLAFWTSYGRLFIGKDTRNPIFATELDYVMAGCGLLYAFLSYMQEGRWLYSQILAVRNLPTSAVASVAPGLAELSGIVRHSGNRELRLNSDRTVMSFLWDLAGTKRNPDGKTTDLGTYKKEMSKFYLDDGSGAILIDPDHPGVELRRPFITILSNWFGSRSFEVILTRHVERISWHRKKYELKEGDRVYVVGNVEIDPSALPDAAGPERFVVRPRPEARSGKGSILQFLVPGRTPSRTTHDIFIISDTDETRAEALLRRNYYFSVCVSAVLAILSAALVIVAINLP